MAEVDLLRPLSRSLAIRAEVATNAEERAEVLSAEAATLREELTAAQNEVEALTSRVGAAEEDAQAKGSRLSGLEKVVRRLGGETEVSFLSFKTREALRQSDRKGNNFPLFSIFFVWFPYLVFLLVFSIILLHNCFKRSHFSTFQHNFFFLVRSPLRWSTTC